MPATTAAHLSGTPLEESLSVAEVLRELNRRLDELGWPARAEADGGSEGSLLVRGLGASSSRPPLRLSLQPGDLDAEVVRLLEVRRARGRDLAPTATGRIARSSIWCEPP